MIFRNNADKKTVLSAFICVHRRLKVFTRAFWRWAALFFAAFLLVHIWWSVRGFRRDLPDSRRL
jgi:hypothetical protein